MIREYLIPKLFKLLGARWIVRDDAPGEGDAGIRILGVNMWFYKWDDVFLSGKDCREWRPAEKRAICNQYNKRFSRI